MQVPIEQISLEDRIKELSRVFAGCVRAEYEGVLPNATVTIHVKQHKSGERGEGKSAIRYDISDDTVSDETLEYQMNLHREPLTQRFLDKASSEYLESKRYPGVDNQIRHLGKVLEMRHLKMGSTELPDCDESDFCEIAEFALKKHWIYRIEIDRDLKIKMVECTLPSLLKEIVEHGPEFIEFIKDNLPN